MNINTKAGKFLKYRLMTVYINYSYIKYICWYESSPQKKCLTNTNAWSGAFKGTSPFSGLCSVVLNRCGAGLGGSGVLSWSLKRVSCSKIGERCSRRHSLHPSLPGQVHLSWTQAILKMSTPTDNELRTETSLPAKQRQPAPTSAKRWHLQDTPSSLPPRERRKAVVIGCAGGDKLFPTEHLELMV